jgi:CRISPR-associated protein Csh2
MIKRREFVAIYQVEMNNPNGDPLADNMPRMLSEEDILLVSDVRIKRTIRDQLFRDGECVFVRPIQDDKGKFLSLEQRYLEPDIQGTKKDDYKTIKDKITKCIDVRLFGSTLAMKNQNMALTGPVQISWGKSLHKVDPKLMQISSSYSSSDSGNQTTLGTIWKVPYVMIAVYGVVNNYLAEDTGMTEEDYSKMKEAWRKGTMNLVSHSKIGHKPLAWIEVEWKDYDGYIGPLYHRMVLKENGEPLTDKYLNLPPKQAILEINLTDIPDKYQVSKELYDKYILSDIIITK